MNLFKKTILVIILSLGFILPIGDVKAQGVTQVNTTKSLYNLPIAPIPCNKIDPSLSCPVETQPIYSALGDTCASGFDDFLTNPIGKHYWVEDPAITAQGKADERARQFLYWVVNTGTVNEQEVPILGTIWRISSSIALFGVVLIASIFGIGYIISRRTNYNLNIQVWPTLIKLGAMLLYIVSSAAIVFVLIQLSDILMKFFIDNLGGNQLFNIYFSGNPAHQNLIGQTEANYKDFVGCRDLNIRVQEGIDTEVFLLKMTNVSYYVMGVMLLLRKILLWFLLFVSPFLALLMPFVLIRNTGWIWIGVFFQWLFYGPLLALFLGGMAKIWSTGIPFKFDFSRVNKVDIGYVYPTGINIVYGGPAQRLARSIGAVNNGNYIDTFVEYIITLIMLWAVTFFPWWLLRIFRDYCCDGIYAMKNILLAMYDQLRGGPPHGPTPGKGPTPPTLKIDTNTPVRADIKISLGTLQEIKNTLSKDISKNLNIEAKHITDIARMETNKTAHQIVNQNIAYLSNPAQAQNPAQKQQFMNIRSELFNRSIKNDTIARTILASTSTSVAEKARISNQLIRSNPQLASIEQISMNNTHRTKQQVTSMTNNYVTTVSNNSTVVKNIANSTSTSESTVKSILESYSKHTNQPITTIVSTVAREANISENTVRSVLSHGGAVGIQARIIAEMGTEQKINSDQADKILSGMHENFVSEKTNAVEKSTISTFVNLSDSQNIVDKSTVTQIIDTFSQNGNLIENISKESHTTIKETSDVIRSYMNHVEENSNNIVNSISNDTQVSTHDVRNIVKNVSNAIARDSNLSRIISQDSKIPEAIVLKVTNAMPQTVSQAQTISDPTLRYISSQINISKINVAPLTQESIMKFITAIQNNSNIVSKLTQSTKLSENTIKNIFTSFTENIASPVSTVINNVSESNSISKDKVEKIFSTLTQIVTSDESSRNQLATSTTFSPQEVSTLSTNISKVINQSQTPTLVKSEPIVDSINTFASTPFPITSKSIENVYRSILNSPSLIESVENSTQLDRQVVQNTIQTFIDNSAHNPTEIMKAITSNSATSSIQVENIFHSISEALTTSGTAINSISSQTNVDENTVKSIVNNTDTIVHNESQNIQSQSKPFIQTLNTSVTNSTQNSESAIHNLFSVINSDKSLIHTVASSSNIQTDVIETLLKTLTSNISSSSSNLLSSLTQATNLSSVQIQSVLNTLSNTIQTSKEVQNSIMQTSQLPQETIMTITKSISSVLTTKEEKDDSPVLSKLTEKIKVETISDQSIQHVFSSLANSQLFIQTASHDTNIEEKTIETMIQTFEKNLDQTPSEIMNTLVKTTNLSRETITTAMTKISNIMSGSEVIQKEITEKTGINPNVIVQMANTIPTIVTAEKSTSTSNTVGEPIVRIISYQAGTTEKQSKKFIQKLLRDVAQNDSVMKSLEVSTNLQSQQISNIINTYIDNIDQPVEKLIQKINESSGVSRDQVQSLLKNIAETIISSKTVVAQVAMDQGMNELDVAKNIQDQMTIASEPEKHIEQSINIPQSISIEDYEEVKEMWKKQYEEGEVPVSDTIKTRKEWIEQEIVFITNTLNKILSSDEKLRQEGLDDLGYLLPVFLINNLTGEELIIYLKAKLEAAKFVLEILNREDKIKQEFLQKQEEDTQVYVDVERKTEDENIHHLDIDEDTALTPLSIEDRTKITEEKLNQTSNANTDSSPDLNAIKEKLKEKAVN